MDDLEPPVSKKEDELCSFILKILQKRFANFSDRLKSDNLPQTFKLDEISKLEKLEGNLKKAKEVLALHIKNRRRDVWMHKLTFFAIMPIFINFILLITSSSSDGTGFWLKIVSIVESVILILLFGFTIVEGIVNKIVNWRRRRNTTTKVSPENGDENNETKEDDLNCENLKIRYRKLFEDLQENFTPYEKPV